MRGVLPGFRYEGICPDVRVYDTKWAVNDCIGFLERKNTYDVFEYDFTTDEKNYYITFGSPNVPRKFGLQFCPGSVYRINFCAIENYTKIIVEFSHVVGKDYLAAHISAEYLDDFFRTKLDAKNRLVHQKITTAIDNVITGIDEMHFFYGKNSEPVMVKHNDTVYSYIRNLQGDIVGIVDTSGTMVVEYKYTVWGAKINISVNEDYAILANNNPFRYRGYVWDEETGLYYLRNRYYNPEWCRFISADMLMPVFKSALVKNIFTYCMNNPCVMSDNSGLAETAFIDGGTVFWEGATADTANVVLYVYTPETQNISKGKIGHFELGIKYDGTWLVYSFGKGDKKLKGKETEDVRDDVYYGKISVRAEPQWSKSTAYTKYSFGMHADEERISEAIEYMSMLAKGKKVKPRPKKFPVQKTEGMEFYKYSLTSEGYVCRDFVCKVLDILGLNIMKTEWATNNNSYYPLGFMNNYRIHTEGLGPWLS